MKESEHSKKITSINGMGGVGKTELALQYSQLHWQNRNFLGGICWLRARKVEEDNQLVMDVGTQIVQFAQSLLSLKPPEDLPLVDRVRFCWEHWPSGEVLVVFDDVSNFKNIESYLPKTDPRFKILITTRLKLGASVTSLKIDVLSQDASLELLEQLVGQERIEAERENTEILCDLLGCLPLGLELVGHYLANKLDLSIQEMQERLLPQPLAARALWKVEPGMTARLGVKLAFDLSWQSLTHSAKRLGCLLSLFATKPVAWSIIDDGLTKSDSEELENNRDYELLRLNLLQRCDKGTYELHQLLREFFRMKLEESDWIDEIKKVFCQRMLNIARTIPEIPTQNIYSEITTLIPHLEATTNLYNHINEEDISWLFVGLGRFYKGQGLYKQAEEWYKKHLYISRELFGNEHIEVASSLNNLGLLFMMRGKLGEAESLLLEAKTLANKIIDENNLYLADIFNNLALVYSSPIYFNQCEHFITRRSLYKKAEKLFQQSLDIWENSLGTDTLNVAKSLNNLGMLCVEQQQYEDAKKYLKRAKKIREKIIDGDHTAKAESLNNLALLYKHEQKTQKSEDLYIQALAMNKRLLGDKHLNIAKSLWNLADIYRILSNHETAILLFKQAIKMLDDCLGSEHPNTLNARDTFKEWYPKQQS